MTVLGRFDLHKFKCLCQQCGGIFDPFVMQTLISSGYWPSSFKNVNYIIHEDVFLSWDMFRKRMPGSSEKSFLESLNDLASFHGRVRYQIFIFRKIQSNKYINHIINTILLHND